MIKAGAFLLLLLLLRKNCDAMRVEAYWDSTYVIPHTRTNCEERTLAVTNFNIRNLLSEEFDSGEVTINIAFADFDIERCERPHRCREIVCGLKLYEDVDENLFTGLISAIREVQDEGRLVKLSFGGAKLGNLKVFTKTTHVADRIIDGIVERALALGVDGVDLVQSEGSGRRNLRCDDQSSIHLRILEGLRRKLPKGKLLSYSFPVSTYNPIFDAGDDVAALDFPFVDVVKYGHGYLDSISLMGVRSNKTIQSVLDLGVPASKIIWGFTKGCSGKRGEATVEDAEHFAREAKEMKLAGVSMWSLNRGVRQFNGTTCTTLDIAPDGSFFSAIAKGWK